MALFNQSIKVVSAAIQEIADAAGVSGDPEMQVRAGRSFNAAIGHFNTRANWDFAITEAAPISVIAPFSISGVTASAGQSSALLPGGHGILIDDLISNPNLNTGTRVTATAAGSIGLDTAFGSGLGAGNVVINLTGNRDMYPLPSDFRMPYSIRIYGSQNAIRPIRRRQYDRSIVDEFTPSTPVGYDISQIGAKGKIRLIPVPAVTDTMKIRYYRRMTEASATAATDFVDIPQDYDQYLIGWAKWHFLMDKGEGRGDQAQAWLTFATDGIKIMIADQTRIPDEDLMMVPGAFMYNPAFGPNSVRGTIDQYSAY